MFTPHSSQLGICGRCAAPCCPVLPRHAVRGRTSERASRPLAGSFGFATTKHEAQQNTPVDSARLWAPFSPAGNKHTSSINRPPLGPMSEGDVIPARAASHHRRRGTPPGHPPPSSPFEPCELLEHVHSQLAVLTRDRKLLMCSSVLSGHSPAHAVQDLCQMGQSSPEKG